MLEQFLAYIKKHSLVSSEEKTLIGASAGVDSTVLVHLFHSAKLPFALAHMNFQLRGAAAHADEAFVSHLAEMYNVPFFSKRVNTKVFAKKKGISTQMAARDLRYTWFKQIMQTKGYSKVAVGTHLNDQLETVLLNLTRETGIRGLSGIAPERDRIIRPLLPFSKREIETYAHANQISHREDGSNADTTYRRNRIRLKVIPELEKINPSLVRSFAQTLNHLSLTASFLEDSLQEQLSAAVTIEGDTQKASKTIFRQKHGNLLLHAWLAPFGFSKDTLNNVLDAIAGALFHSATHTLNVTSEELILVSSQNAPLQPVPFQIPSTGFQYADYLFFAELTNNDEINPNPLVARLNPESIKGELVFKPLEAGDRIQPLGMKGFKKLSDILSDAKVPRIFRERIPILCDDLGPIWVVGHTISERVKLVNSGKKIYLITAKSIR